MMNGGRGRGHGQDRDDRESRDEGKIQEQEKKGRKQPVEASSLKPAIITELSAQTKSPSALSRLNYKI